LSASHDLHSARSNLPHRGCLAYARKGLKPSSERYRIPPLRWRRLRTS
jgi:hypothetical protein